MSAKSLKAHPYADRFPMLPESELAALAQSIATSGLRMPITVTPDDLILDGRNRYAACQMAGVEPTFEVYEGEDIAEFVIDANIARRNMTTGQRAMAAALVLQADGRRVNGRWKRGSVDIAKSGNSASDWQHRLAEAGLVLDLQPKLAAKVVDGELLLEHAYKEACEVRDAEKNRKAQEAREAEEESAAQAFIEENAPDLAALVGGDIQDYAEALAVWEKRNRDEVRRIAEERAAEEAIRQANAELYGGIAEALKAIGAYGGYTDIPDLMAAYQPDDLNPPQLDRYLDVQNLQSAQRFIGELMKWRKKEGRP